jgi:magnesium-transporting ATPase (P-type)
MDESSFTLEEGSGAIKFMGQPTECALLKFAADMGYDFTNIRTTVQGRTDESRKLHGKKIDYSSSRKMMSWAVRHGSGFRIYSKGGGEVVLPRCRNMLGSGGAISVLSSECTDEAVDMIATFASESMRTICLAFRDLPGNGTRC